VFVPGIILATNEPLIRIIFDLDIVNILPFSLIVGTEFRCQGLIIFLEGVVFWESSRCSRDIVECTAKATTSKKSFYEDIMPCCVSK
jgi:hypothetical protein